MLAKSKLNSIEALVSQALIDMEKSHEEFAAIFKEKDKYEMMKENIRNVSEKLEEKAENMRPNGVHSRTYNKKITSERKLLKKKFIKNLLNIYQKLLNICAIKNYYCFFCTCKMVLKITKETWEKCGIKTVKHYNEQKHMIELWHKMSDVEEQTNHSNIAEVVLRRIRKFYGKKTEIITEEEKQKYKVYLEGEKGFFIIEKLTRDVIERLSYQKP